MQLATTWQQDDEIRGSTCFTGCLQSFRV